MGIGNFIGQKVLLQHGMLTKQVLVRFGDFKLINVCFKLLFLPKALMSVISGAVPILTKIALEPLFWLWQYSYTP